MKSTNRIRACRVIASFVFFAAALCGGAGAQMQFVEVGGLVGIQEYTMASGQGGGIVAADFDNDNDIDLFVPNGEGVPDQLYRNTGLGQFEEIAAEAGVASTDSHRVALWVDYTGDGRLDLIVVGDCLLFENDSPVIDNSCTPSITVYKQNEQGTFDDVTGDTGIVNPFGAATDPDGNAQYSGISAGDINNDGFLDLVFALWRGTSILLLNNGDGTFTDISFSSNVGTQEESIWQYVFHDFNDDGWLDMHAAVDFGEDHLYINQGDNTFLDLAVSAGVDHTANEMGIALGDYDNDSDIDMYLTNIDLDSSPDLRNVLYRNDSIGGTALFQEVAIESNVAFTEWGWGCTFLDGDNDGLLDLAVTNGYFRILRVGFSPRWATDPSFFFRNLGGDPVTFGDVSDSVGFNDTFFGSSLVALDYNRDGHLDLVQTTQVVGDLPSEAPSQVRVMRNNPNEATDSNNYVVIKPRMEGANHFAIGATVHVRIGTESLMRLITAGISFMGQEPAEAHFGLGSVDMIDEVRIEWPGGGSSTFFNVSANRIYTAGASSIEVELRNLDLDRDGLDDEQEVLVHGTDPTLFDTDGDGVSDGIEVTFGSDPLDPDDFVSLPTLGRVGQGLLFLLLAYVALRLRRKPWAYEMD